MYYFKAVENVRLRLNSDSVKTDKLYQYNNSLTATKIMNQRKFQVKTNKQKKKKQKKKRPFVSELFNIIDYSQGQ